jgi:hypothetical protein
MMTGSAKQSSPSAIRFWIASSLKLLAMTVVVILVTRQATTLAAFGKLRDSVRSNESFDGAGRVMYPAGKISVSLVLLTAVFAVTNRALQAQQNPPAPLLNQIQTANEECKRKYPDPIKQAVAYTSCENRNMELLRPSMVYPDLMDQELANNLMLAEKVQKGRMTLIEMKAVKAQLHSQIVTEFQRRQLAKTAVASRPAAPAINSTTFAGQPAPVVPPGPPQQNTPPREPHCQVARFGMMLETVCN